MSERAQRIARMLTERFAPSSLEVSDDSARHAGHAGAAPGGQSHYSVRIVSAAFAGLSRVERQRLVNAALQEEFESGLHALSIRAAAPGES